MGESGTTFGSTAEYQCDEGYVFENGDTRTCLTSGEWSNTVKCGKLVVFIICKIIFEWEFTCKFSAVFHCLWKKFYIANCYNVSK